MLTTAERTNYHGKSPGGSSVNSSRLLVQRRTASSATPAAQSVAPPIVHDVLRSAGKPLDADSRAFFEPRFGHDFSNVRIHADSSAAQSARSVEALAYTVGNNIAFAQGRYAPSSPQGRELLAHELAHVVQQGGAGQSAGDLEVSPAESSSERQADSAAKTVMRGGSQMSLSSQAAGVARVPDPSVPAAPGRATVSPIMDSKMDGFATGSAAIPDQAKLVEMAAYVKWNLGKNPGSYAIITGHTDAVGSESSNMALGQQRADSIKAGLIKRGLPPEKLTTASAGASDPVVKTAKEESRNRRVEIKMMAPSTMQTGGAQSNPGPAAAPADAPTKDVPSPWSMDPKGQDVPPAWKPNLLPAPDLQDKPLPGPRAQHLDPSIFNPYIPPNPIKPTPSLFDQAYEKTAGKIVKAVAKGLGLSAERTKDLDDLVKGAVMKGSKAALKAGLDAMHANTQEINAAEAAFEAFMKENGGPRPQPVPVPQGVPPLK